MTEDHSPCAIVADDEALIRLDATDILQDAGYRTHEACNVEDAIEILERLDGKVDLLFTDVQMPPSDRNGFELARICAKRWPNIGIIIVSGQAKAEHHEMPDGARFISKPFNAHAVQKQLQEIHRVRVE